MEQVENSMNAFAAKEHFMAMDTRNIFVSYSGDYKKSRMPQVHNSCEILFVEEGEADYRINGRNYPVKNRSVLIIGSHDHHESYITKLPYIRYGITLMTDFLQTFPIISQYMNVYRTQSVEHYNQLYQVDELVFRHMIEVLRVLYRETKENEKGKGDLVYALLLELTILLKRILHLEKEEISDAHRMIRQIKNYIDLHYNQDLSLSTLSGIFYVQPNTISKNFSSIMGETMNTYINAVRITNAVYLLERTELSVTEVAEHVGYESINTFLRQFKKKMGVSPLKYRKRYNNILKSKDTRHFLL